MSSKLFLTGNKGSWSVFDDEMFCFGVGETPDEAITSARQLSDEPIETYWGVVEHAKTTL